jgi:hypothetical protein
MKYGKVLVTMVAIMATAAAASAAQVTVDVDVLRALIQEEIGKAIAAKPETATPAAVVSTNAPNILSETGVTNPLTGPSPVVYEEVGAGEYVSVAPATTSPAVESATFKTVGDTVHVVEPSRGLTVGKEELRARYFTRLVETKDGLINEEKLPLMVPGEAYQFSWPIRSLHDLFTLSKISGLKLVSFGINNLEEAVLGKPVDGPVKTTKVFVVGGINERYELAGTEMLLINTKKERKVLSSREHRDFDGIAYWARMVAPVDVVVGKLYPIHHKSAELRPVGYVVPAGEIFTLFLGGKESVLGKDNGRELCVPIHPARVLRK